MEQGMSTALQVEKTSKRGGKIIHERDIKKAEEQQKLDNSNANLLKNPSKVVVLRVTQLSHYLTLTQT
jgi:splicing factor 45